MGYLACRVFAPWAAGVVKMGLCGLVRCHMLANQLFTRSVSSYMAPRMKITDYTQASRINRGKSREKSQSKIPLKSHRLVRHPMFVFARTEKQPEWFIIWILVLTDGFARVEVKNYRLGIIRRDSYKSFQPLKFVGDLYRLELSSRSWVCSQTGEL